jgi:hypothetical protein
MVATPKVTQEKGAGASGETDIIEAAKRLVSPIVCVDGLKMIGLVITRP